MTRSPWPAALRPQDIVCIIDSREQLPYNLEPLRSITGTLPTGDYTIRGLEELVAIERKSLSDFVSCCGANRDAFERELLRLRAYEMRCVVVEASWADVERGEWRSKITPQSVTGSVLGWIASGIPILLAGDREAAQQATARLLYTAARRRYRELRALAAAAGEVTA